MKTRRAQRKCGGSGMKTRHQRLRVPPVVEKPKNREVVVEYTVASGGFLTEAQKKKIISTIKRSEYGYYKYFDERGVFKYTFNDTGDSTKATFVLKGWGSTADIMYERMLYTLLGQFPEALPVGVTTKLVRSKVV